MEHRESTAIQETKANREQQGQMETQEHKSFKEFKV